MQPTPLKSMRANAGIPPPAAITRWMHSRTTRPVGRVTRSVYTPAVDSWSTECTSICWITALRTPARV